MITIIHSAGSERRLGDGTRASTDRKSPRFRALRAQVTRCLGRPRRPQRTARSTRESLRRDPLRGAESNPQ
jgi:hypothetical protein